MLGTEPVAVTGLATLGQARVIVMMVGRGCTRVAHRHAHVHVLVAWRHVVVAGLCGRGHVAHRHARGGMRIRRAVEQQRKAEQGTEQGSDAGHAAIIRHAAGRTAA